MKVLVTAGRNFDSPHRVQQALRQLRREHEHIELVVGGGWGADQDALAAALALQYDGIHVYPAQRDMHGRLADPRNRTMLDLHTDIDLVLWFHDNLDDSRHTRELVDEAQRRGIRTEAG